MKLTGENRQRGEKPVPVPLCPPQTPHGLTRDPGLRGERPATNRLSHGTAMLLWDIMHRRVVILYRRFRTTYRSHLDGSRSPRRKDFLTLEDGTDTLS
jgi:hypothetical protein